MCEDHPETDIVRARRAAWLIDVAAVRGIYRANCLERSLALWCVLGRQGIESRIRFGSRKVDGRFDAHAWVEVGWEIVNDAPDTRNHFAPFDDIHSISALNFE